MTLRIGILGAARVATYAMIAAAKDVDGVDVAAVAARDPVRARAYADQHGIPNIYPDYAALVAAADIDAIYNALPPHLHAKWSIAALEAGKAVLCEKPFTLTIADTEAMLAAEARTGHLLMEAQHTYHHPRHARIREIVQSGMLGKIRQISSQFDVPIPKDNDDIRWNGPVGGGALWDLGVYPVFWLREAMGEEPQLLSARHRLTESGADAETDAEFGFASGATGSIRCSMERDFACWLEVEGDCGTLSVPNPLSPPKQTLTLDIGGVVSEEVFSERTTYAFQLEAFRDAVLHDAPVATRGEDSLATIRLLSDIREMAMKG